jgi:hypothetical protein
MLLKTYSALKIKHSLNWDEALVLTGFSYPWLVQSPPVMSFRALWDDARFYFRFDIEATRVRTYVHDNHKIEVMDSDRVEIFLKSDDRLDPYYCLEMDSLGRVLDYKACFYRKFDYTWQWPGTNHLQVESTLTDSGYRVNGSITLASLGQLNLIKNKELQVGLFRGECLKNRDPESRFSWISWIKPESVRPDFHIPSSFGVIKLETWEEERGTRDK